jgi:heat shock protein beta-11
LFADPPFASFRWCVLFSFSFSFSLFSLFLSFSRSSNPKTYWLTSGLFPHEVVFAFPSPIRIHTIHLSSRYIRSFSVQICDKNNPVTFESIWSNDLAAGSDGIQQEQNEFDGVIAKYVKLVIEKGWNDFTAVYQLRVDGSAEG